MSRYIDADELEETMLYGMCGTGYQTLALLLIKEVPTADVEPVRHSVWRVASADPDKEYECMKCKKAVGWKYLYCPNCGARMDGEEQEHD